MENKITNKKDSGWKTLADDKKEEVFDFCNEYINFLNKSKTERLAVEEIINVLNCNGFKNMEDNEKILPGDKVYLINKYKSIYAAVIGKNSLEEGINIIGSHIDSPRLDLKPNPLYETSSLALFKTHYYGGIKKYQWTAIPLTILGVIVKPNGEKIKISLGEEIDDFTFTITDLLPHLSKKQQEEKLKDAILGEDLNLLIGSIPDDEDSIKNNILKLINEKYDIKEIDFNSSELEVVPAFNAKSLGLDKSMIASYGQDDKVCAYTSLKSLIDCNNIERTVVSIFSDKEEIGSVGNTGMCSQTFDYFISELSIKINGKYSNLNKIYFNSFMLSADVGAAVEPNKQEFFEENNSSKLGYGVEINKYTGSSGKTGASDANAEYIAKVRNIFEKNNIKYQFSELGKIDIGGGGTIAYILANKGIEVLDCGVPVLSMHSPYEVTSKFDVYEAYKAYKAFFEYKATK